MTLIAARSRYKPHSKSLRSCAGSAWKFALAEHFQTGSNYNDVRQIFQGREMPIAELVEPVAGNGADRRSVAVAARVDSQMPEQMADENARSRSGEILRLKLNVRTMDLQIAAIDLEHSATMVT